MSENKHKNSSQVDYSIGIVTYVERFNKSFKQLALELGRQFPDVEKNVILNGFPDKEKQLRYIKEATAFLNKCGFNRVITFEEHQPLAKGWNLLIINSDAPKIMILNDDCLVGPNFRNEFESQRLDYDWVFINESFSHFMTSKKVVKLVGWFDERFLGIGHEDGDYARRCAIKNYEYDIGIECPSLKNLQIQEEFVSFTTKKNEKSGNYSLYNERFFKKKWSHASYAKTGYTYIPIRHLKRYTDLPLGEGSFCKLNRGMETPEFYPLAILD